MLREAVQAKIPLIAVTSNDPVHDHFLLRALFPEYKVTHWSGRTQLDEYEEEAGQTLYYSYSDTELDIMRVYEEAQALEVSVIFINPEGDYATMFKAGELLPDKETVYSMLYKVFPQELCAEAVENMVGLTVRGVKEVIALTSVFYDEITPLTLRKTKDRLFLNQTGIIPVDTASEFYLPSDGDLVDWVSTNEPYMFASTDPRLVPRGLMLYGPPGTGKTEAAKYIAREWGIPLFLMDINSMLTKWQGEAEQHLTNALTTFDNESPCVVLFDEVEKLFTTGDGSETTQRLLSKLLWWLQFRQSRVLVVMTSNNLEKIPAEFYRPGRVDDVIHLDGLWPPEAKVFVESLLSTFGEDDPRIKQALEATIERCINGVDTRISQAVLTGTAIDELRVAGYGID